MTSVVTFLSPKAGFPVLNIFALSVTSSTAWLFPLRYYWNQSQYIPTQSNSSSIHVFSKHVLSARPCLVAHFPTVIPFFFSSTEAWCLRGIFDPIVFKDSKSSWFCYSGTQFSEYLLSPAYVYDTWDTIANKTDKNPSLCKVYSLAGEHLRCMPGVCEEQQGVMVVGQCV